MTLKCKAFACLLSLTALAISACGSSTESHANMTSLENADSGFTFTAKNRTARQELPSDLRSPQDYKFVEVVLAIGPEVVKTSEYLPELLSAPFAMSV